MSDNIDECSGMCVEYRNFLECLANCHSNSKEVTVGEVLLRMKANNMPATHLQKLLSYTAGTYKFLLTVILTNLLRRLRRSMVIYNIIFCT